MKERLSMYLSVSLCTSVQCVSVAYKPVLIHLESSVTKNSDSWPDVDYKLGGLNI